MDVQPSESNALQRKRSSTALMAPPPPVKKIRRPKKVLDEDSYTETLSQIIARDFFPGLLETEIQQEYLDAVESKDSGWISSAGRRLKQVMTPGRLQTPFPISTFNHGGRTPTTDTGETPASTVPGPSARNASLSSNMSLSKFQATYTSEDNESFYKLVDKQNQQKADKYAWLWRGNKLPSKQMIKQREVIDKLEKTQNLLDQGTRHDLLAIKDADKRPARPDAWNAAPKNGLMFQPDGLEDGVVTVAQKSEESSRMAPKRIVYENTRMPQTHTIARPPSPTLSSVRDAIAGRPRQKDQDSSVVVGGETPRVNGYAFVDDEEEEATEPLPAFNFGPADATNPFKLQEQRKRETLHERMVDRIAKNNKESSKIGMTGRADTSQVPKFPSSPRVSGNLTPAAQRLWNKVGSTSNKTNSNSFAPSTPMRARGSLLKSVSQSNSKPCP